MIEELIPSDDEKEFLKLVYNRFFDIYEEIISDLFLYQSIFHVIHLSSLDHKSIQKLN
jgi:hypothetical protein